jgi:thioredoxin-related protein
MKLLFSILLSFGLITGAVAQEQPKPADKIFKEACSLAKQDNKKVMIIFHASWCGWCKRMDSIMNMPELKPLFEKNFVIEHMVVLESGTKKALENPGAEAFMNKNGGTKQGIPFWLIFNKKGKLLSDSRMPSKDKAGKAKLANTGCPAQPDEVAFFVGLLKKTTNLTEAELALISEKFVMKKAGTTH